MGMKPPDKFTVPLCRLCHGEAHKMGKSRFEKFVGIDLLTVALTLNDIYLTKVTKNP
jgi:hypothetical protein